MSWKPPSKYRISTNKQGYKKLDELPDDIPTWTTNTGKTSGSKNKRKIFDEDSYWDEDDDPPPSKSASYDPFNPTGDNDMGNNYDDGEVDPLDAFMAENDKEVKNSQGLVFRSLAQILFQLNYRNQFTFIK